MLPQQALDGGEAEPVASCQGTSRCTSAVDVQEDVNVLLGHAVCDAPDTRRVVCHELIRRPVTVSTACVLLTVGAELMFGLR